MKHIKWALLILMIFIITIDSIIRIKMGPLVSVVMPVYNREKLVGRAIESILNQTYQNFEFIIVEDGSTDGTLRVLQDYAKKDSRIKILSNQKNMGISYSRQRGLDMATGKYVAIMDSDDYSVPERLEKTVAFLEDYSDITAVSGEVISFDNDDFPTFPIEEKVRQLYRIKHDVGYHEVELLFDNTFSNVVSLFRRDFVKKNNIRYNLSFQSAEDYDFWIQIVLAGGRFASLSDVLGYVRNHRTNSQSYYDAMVLNSIRIHKKVFELFFTPTKEDLKFDYNQLEYCSIMEKMKNSKQPRSVIPNAMIEQRYILRKCPPTTKGAFYLYHKFWHDFLIPIEGKKYRRYFSKDIGRVELKGNDLVIYWEGWNPEKFRRKSPNVFEFQKEL